MIGSSGARILDGKGTARKIRQEVAEAAAKLRSESGVVPGLTVVLVGDDPASAIYVRNKERAARKAGIDSRVVRLAAGASEEDVIETVVSLNRDPAVHGILVQLPLPRGLSDRRVIETIDPRKDVDAFHPENVGRLSIGLDGFAPCTPAGIVRLLEEHEIPLSGQHAVVLGRSNIVGKPMALLLLARHCTVTVCHSRTRDIASIASTADILVAAVGRPGFVTAEHVKPGAVVVDVGIHRVESEDECREYYGDDPARLAALREKGATLVGDVHPRQVRERAGGLSTVPGGVGPLTIAWLLRNTVDAATRLSSE